MSGVVTVDLKEPTGASSPKVMVHGVRSPMDRSPVVAINALGHGNALVYIRADEWLKIEAAARAILGLPNGGGA